MGHGSWVDRPHYNFHDCEIEAKSISAQKMLSLSQRIMQAD